MVNGIGSKPYSYMDQLLGVSPQEVKPTVIPTVTNPTAPITGNPATYTKQVQLSKEVLAILQNSDQTKYSGLFTESKGSQIDNSPLAQLLGTAKKTSKNPYSEMLSLTSMASLYKTAFNGTIQKNQQDFLNSLGNRGLIA